MTVLFEIVDGPAWLREDSSGYVGSREPGYVELHVSCNISENGQVSDAARFVLSGEIPCQPPVWTTPAWLEPGVCSTGSRWGVRARSYGASAIEYELTDASSAAALISSGSGDLVTLVDSGGDAGLRAATVAATASLPGASSSGSSKKFEYLMIENADPRTHREIVCDSVSSARHPHGDSGLVHAARRSDMVAHCDAWSLVYCVGGPATVTFGGVVIATHDATDGELRAVVGHVDVATCANSGAPACHVLTVDRRKLRARIACISPGTYGESEWLALPGRPAAWDAEVSGPGAGPSVVATASNDGRVLDMLQTVFDVPEFPIPDDHVAFVGVPLEIPSSVGDLAISVESSDVADGAGGVGTATAAGDYASVVVATAPSGLYVRSPVRIRACDVVFGPLDAEVWRVADDFDNMVVVGGTPGFDYTVSATSAVHVSGQYSLQVADGPDPDSVTLVAPPPMDGEYVLTCSVTARVDDVFSTATFLGRFVVRNALPAWIEPAGAQQNYVGEVFHVRLRAEAPEEYSRRAVEYVSDHPYVAVDGDVMTVTSATPGVTEVPVDAVVDELTVSARTVAVDAFERVDARDVATVASASERGLSPAGGPLESPVRLERVGDLLAVSAIAAVDVTVGEVEISVAGFSARFSKAGVVDSATGAFVLSGTLPDRFVAYVAWLGHDRFEAGGAGLVSAIDRASATTPVSATPTGGALCGPVFAYPSAFHPVEVDPWTLVLDPPPTTADEIVVARGAPFRHALPHPPSSWSLVEGQEVVVASGEVRGTTTSVGTRTIVLRFRRDNGTTIDVGMRITTVDLAIHDVPRMEVVVGEENAVPVYAYASHYNDDVAISATTADAGLVADVAEVDVGVRGVRTTAHAAGDFEIELVATLGYARTTSIVVVTAEAPEVQWGGGGVSIRAFAGCRVSYPVLVEDGAIVEVHHAGSTDAEMETRDAGGAWLVATCGPSDAVVTLVARKPWRNPSYVAVDLRVSDNARYSAGVEISSILDSCRSTARFDALRHVLPNEGDFGFVPVTRGALEVGYFVVYGGSGRFAFRACQCLTVRHSGSRAEIELDGLAVGGATVDGEPWLFALAVTESAIFWESAGGSAIRVEYARETWPADESPPAFEHVSAESGRCGDVCACLPVRDDRAQRYARDRPHFLAGVVADASFWTPRDVAARVGRYANEKIRHAPSTRPPPFRSAFPDVFDASSFAALRSLAPGGIASFLPRVVASPPGPEGRNAAFWFFHATGPYRVRVHPLVELSRSADGSVRVAVPDGVRVVAPEDASDAVCVAVSDDAAYVQLEGSAAVAMAVLEARASESAALEFVDLTAASSVGAVAIRIEASGSVFDRFFDDAAVGGVPHANAFDSAYSLALSSFEVPYPLVDPGAKRFPAVSASPASGHAVQVHVPTGNDAVFEALAPGVTAVEVTSARGCDVVRRNVVVTSQHTRPEWSAESATVLASAIPASVVLHATSSGPVTYSVAHAYPPGTTCRVVGDRCYIDSVVPGSVVLVSAWSSGSLRSSKDFAVSVV